MNARAWLRARRWCFWQVGNNRVALLTRSDAARSTIRPESSAPYGPRRTIALATLRALHSSPPVSSGRRAFSRSFRKLGTITDNNTVDGRAVSRVQCSLRKKWNTQTIPPSYA
jgi:hypothetical protein